MRTILFSADHPNRLRCSIERWAERLWITKEILRPLLAFVEIAVANLNIWTGWHGRGPPRKYDDNGRLSRGFVEIRGHEFRGPTFLDR
jgi:hypothetical protein